MCYKADLRDESERSRYATLHMKGCSMEGHATESLRCSFFPASAVLRETISEVAGVSLDDQ